MPPTKPPLDKQCWKWAESTEPADVTTDHVRTAYRLNLHKCKLGQCKRQCKGNPYCLNCIGEKVWFGEIQETTWHDISDPEEERREPGMFVGLKNLGATCYVNTFLQLWFHNDKVKRGICQWRPVDEDSSSDWKPSSVCSHLQVIFGLLELSKRRYVDPSELIHHLGLDAGQQQDAQEFSKLFLSVLEDNLVQNNTSSPHSNVIKQQFCGSYAYVTRCSSCKAASERQSEFYELDLNIQGHKTLDDSLKAFLEVEKLEGDNQYMCNTCNMKQNATRAIELKQLPPVLNLQLLRFVFEIKTGSKKKLNSIIQFPDTLDMSEFLPAGEAATYDLTAVLIHRGPSAYSGHYVAHIKGKDSQAWFKFNDEEIEKIKGRNLKLGNEEDLEVKQKKSMRTPKGHHSSKNAYMLVYTRQTISEAMNEQTNGSSVSFEEPKPESNVSIIEEKKKDEEAVTLSQTQNGISPSPKCEDSGKNQFEKLTNTENEREPLLPKITCPSPKTSPKKSQTNIHSRSEILDQNVKSTMEHKSQSLQDCTVSTTSSSFPVDPLLCNPGPSRECDDQTASETTVVSLLPKYVIDYVEKDNEAFEKWVLEMVEMKNKNIATGREKQETVKTIYKDLVLKDSADQLAFGWLPLSWLSKWLNDPASAPPIDIKPFLCSHGKICPDKSVKMKSVSEAGYKQLLNIYGGSNTLCREESLCSECVKNKCNLIRTKLKIAEDDKLITRELKSPLSGKKCFWIGKGSFRSWKRLAMERLGDAADEAGDAADSCNGSMEEATGSAEDLVEELTESDAKITDNSQTEGCIKVAKEKKEEDATLQFNEDLLCDAHAGLDPDESCRKMIPETVWLMLKKYFPGCPEFDDQIMTCEKCQSCREQENELKKLNKQAAVQQKAALSELFHDRKRPTHMSADSSLYVVNTPFISLWRQFLKDPLRVEPVTSIGNDLLLCPHGGYLFVTHGEHLLKSNETVTYLHAEEWNRLKEFYAVDHEIEVICIMQEDKKEIITIPGVCDECLQTRLSIEESETFDYDNAVLYVRKHLKVEANALNEDSKDDFQNKTSEFEDKAGSNGRKRTMSGSAYLDEPPDKMAKVDENGKHVRKSHRHRRARGEKEVTMSSKSTLKDLKVQIMRIFSVPPFDQNLYIRGRSLGADNSSLLGDLRIAPGTVIDLVADEVEGDQVILEELHKGSAAPEAGFKGTNLLSS